MYTFSKHIWIENPTQRNSYHLTWSLTYPKAPQFSHQKLPFLTMQDILQECQTILTIQIESNNYNIELQETTNWTSNFNKEWLFANNKQSEMVLCQQQTNRNGFMPQENSKICSIEISNFTYHDYKESWNVSPEIPPRSSTP